MQPVSFSAPRSPPGQMKSRPAAASPSRRPSRPTRGRRCGASRRLAVNGARIVQRLSGRRCLPRRVTPRVFAFRRRLSTRPSYRRTPLRNQGPSNPKHQHRRAQQPDGPKKDTRGDRGPPWVLSSVRSLRPLSACQFGSAGKCRPTRPEPCESARSADRPLQSSPASRHTERSAQSRRPRPTP